MLRRVWAVVPAILVLAAGCHSAVGLAADLPPPRNFPAVHPPDAILVAREREERGRPLALKAITWGLLGLQVALQSGWDYNAVTGEQCPVGPRCRSIP